MQKNPHGQAELSYWGYFVNKVKGPIFRGRLLWTALSSIPVTLSLCPDHVMPKTITK